MTEDERDWPVMLAHVEELRLAISVVWHDLGPLQRDLNRLMKRVSAMEAAVDQMAETLGDEGMDDEWT